MKISIITVVYNNEKTIQDAMQSVLGQTYKNIEYVIIDGSSKDNTVNLIKEYKDQLGHFVSEKDNGLYDAMNKGIQACTGDVIGILNSDDLYQDSQVIAAVMEEFKKGQLNIGKSPKKVTSRKQAIAIALSEQKRVNSKKK